MWLPMIQSNLKVSDLFSFHIPSTHPWLWLIGLSQLSRRDLLDEFSTLDFVTKSFSGIPVRHKIHNYKLVYRRKVLATVLHFSSGPPGYPRSGSHVCAHQLICSWKGFYWTLERILLKSDVFKLINSKNYVCGVIICDGLLSCGNHHLMVQ